MKRLRWLSVCVSIAGWLAVTGVSQAQDGGVLHVALAGTMEPVISRHVGPAQMPLNWAMPSSGFQRGVRRRLLVIEDEERLPGILKGDLDDLCPRLSGQQTPGYSKTVRRPSSARRLRFWISGAEHLDEYLSRISPARLCGFIGVGRARSVVEPRATG